MEDFRKAMYAACRQMDMAIVPMDIGARVMAWEMFPKNGSTDGVWFVPESTCINNNYEDGIFQTKITIKQIT